MLNEENNLYASKRLASEKHSVSSRGERLLCVCEGRVMPKMDLQTKRQGPVQLPVQPEQALKEHLSVGLGS
jgi:hypothetical protein